MTLTSGSNMVTLGHQQNDTQLQPYPFVPLTTLPGVNNDFVSIPIEQGVSQPPPYTVQSYGPGVQYGPTSEVNTLTSQSKQQNQQQCIQQQQQQPEAASAVTSNRTCEYTIPI